VTSREEDSTSRTGRLGPGPLGWSAVIAIVVGGRSLGQTTTRVSLGVGGQQADFDSLGSSVSADGVFVAFTSWASNLVVSDTNGADVFVHDVETGITERVSLTDGGGQANLDSFIPCLSADGRYVAFQSFASNIVPGDTNDRIDVFVRDRSAGTTELASVALGGTIANDKSDNHSMSADGRFVTFRSDASNLVPGDTNGVGDVFVRDRLGGTTERVSVSATGVQGNASSYASSISANGRFVAFDSFARNLVPHDTGNRQVFVRDRHTGRNEVVSRSTAGTLGNSWSERPSISWDGRYVAFDSIATNLVAGDANGTSDVFVHDRTTGTTSLVSVASGDLPGNAWSSSPAISADGRYVAFQSVASDLVANDTNGEMDIFVRDRLLGTTERASLSAGGTEVHFGGWNPSISPDGRHVSFDSYGPDVVPGDTNGWNDIFLRDRATTTFPGLCDPGVNGVVACPCSNPADGPGRGCDNSAATGGASILASGTASLAADGVAFTTSGEKPTALSVVLQGDTRVAGGSVFGQGVSCVGGSLLRLYVKTAVAGGILAPDFGGGDPSVSAQSAARGDVIQAGQSRWYLVYYRDPIVLGGCPSNLTFNTTQTRKATWSP
jgi:Tol biopolymer transport system component